MRPKSTVSAPRVVARRGHALVFFEPAEVWAFEADERHVFVHAKTGRFEVDVPLGVLDETFAPEFVRVGRNWLVHFGHVKELASEHGETTLLVGLRGGDGGLRVPVPRLRAAQVRELLLANAVGIRQRTPAAEGEASAAHAGVERVPAAAHEEERQEP